MYVVVVVIKNKKLSSVSTVVDDYIECYIAMNTRIHALTLYFIVFIR